jgi:hypothetical protein
MRNRPAGLIWIALSAIVVWIVEARCQPDPVTPEKAVSAYVKDFMALSPRRRDKALELVPEVVQAATEAGIPPMLLAVTISKESSWRVNVPLGKSRGEIGLTQIHGLAAKGQDLTTPVGQIRAGARWLRKCVDRCGSIREGINAYVSGKCKPITKAGRRRYKIYLLAVERFWYVDHN